MSFGVTYSNPKKFTMGSFIGNRITVSRVTTGDDWTSYWATRSEILFFGLYSEISGGQMPNKVTDATDYLTVAGVAGSETYQCPNTAAYIAADTDHIWFKTDGTQRTATTAELVGYDLQRTPVKYEDESPNEIVAIMILKSGATITGTVRGKLFMNFWLHTLWDNNLNAYGHIKDNRTGQQLWTPESVYEAELTTYISGLSTPLSDGQKTLLDNFIKTIKVDFSIATLSEVFDTIYILAGETEESSLRNLVKNAHYAEAVNSPSFIALEGFTGAATKYINTKYNPSTEGVRYAQNSAAFGIYSRTDNTAGGYEMGAVITGGVDTAIITRSGNTAYNAINQATGTYGSVANFNSSGMFICTRLNANDNDLYRNKLKIIDDTDVSTGLVNGNLFILGRNKDGALDSIVTKQLSFAFTSRGLTSDEVGYLTDAFEAYMDANSKGVI